MKLIKLPLTLAIALMLPMIGAMSIHAQDLNDDQATVQVPEDAKPATRMVNKRLVGWQEAGLGANGDRIGQTLRANWIMLNEFNGIDGQIVGIGSPLTVHLLRDGFVVGRSMTTADGSFRIESASPGPYTAIGYSSDAIFAYSFNAVANDGEAINMPISIQTLPITGVENNRLVAKMIQQYAPEVDFVTYDEYDVGQEKTDPAEWYGWEGLRDLTADSTPATTIRNHQVAILNDGRMIGRIHQLHHRTGRPVQIKNTRIMIIQEGVMLAETQADDSGVFEFEGLSAGSYGLVAIGDDGLMVIGLDLANGGPNVEAQLEETARNSQYSPLFRNITNRQEESVLSTGGEPVVFDACLCNPDSIGWLNSHVEEQSYIDAINEPLPEFNSFGEMPYNYFDSGNLYGSTDQGFFGGGGGFGGGGFGGGFGGGGFLLPLGIAGIIAAAVDDDDYNLGSPIILTSPF